MGFCVIFQLPGNLILRKPWYPYAYLSLTWKQFPKQRNFCFSSSMNKLPGEEEKENQKQSCKILYLYLGNLTKNMSQSLRSWLIAHNATFQLHGVRGLYRSGGGTYQPPPQTRQRKRQAAEEPGNWGGGAGLLGLMALLLEVRWNIKRLRGGKRQRLVRKVWTRDESYNESETIKTRRIAHPWMFRGTASARCDNNWLRDVGAQGNLFCPHPRPLSTGGWCWMRGSDGELGGVGEWNS